MVNHATKNKTVEITVAPYLAGTVNHATMDETVKIEFGTWTHVDSTYVF